MAPLDIKSENRMPSGTILKTVPKNPVYIFYQQTVFNCLLLILGEYERVG